MASVDIFNPQVSTVAKGLEGKVILVYGGNNVGKTKQATLMKADTILHLRLSVTTCVFFL